MINWLVRPTFSRFETVALSIIAAIVWSYDWGWWQVVALFPIVLTIMFINEGLYKSQIGKDRP